MAEDVDLWKVQDTQASQSTVVCLWFVQQSNIFSQVFNDSTPPPTSLSFITNIYQEKADYYFCTLYTKVADFHFLYTQKKLIF